MVRSCELAKAEWKVGDFGMSLRKSSAFRTTGVWPVKVRSTATYDNLVILGGTAATRSPEMAQPRIGTKTRKEVNEPILDN